MQVEWRACCYNVSLIYGALRCLFCSSAATQCILPKCDFKADIRYIRKSTNIKQAAHSCGARRIFYSKISLVSR